MDKIKIVHDLAMLHATEKYKDFYSHLPEDKRSFNAGIEELELYYQTAVTFISSNIDEIMKSYLDDNGNSMLKDWL